MSDSDDLRLNTLARYRKTSKHLALEVYDSCEVPAGCGGVVLRWRSAESPTGISLLHYVRVPFEGPFLDGKLVEEQRTLLAPGEHVLSLILTPSDDLGLLLLQAELSPPIKGAPRPRAVSQAAGRWRAAAREPPEGWQLPGFDSPDFLPLVEKPVPPPKEQDRERWRWESLQRDNAKGLGLPWEVPRTWRFWRRKASLAWVRWSFRISLEGFS